MRPTSFPEWALNATYPSTLPNKVAPALSKINRGWDPNERPSPQFFNWWMNLVGQWVDYFDKATGTADRTESSMPAALLNGSLAPTWKPIGGTIFDQTEVSTFEGLTQILTLPQGGNLSTVKVYLQGSGGHGPNLPTTMPHVELWKGSVVAGTGTMLASVADTSANVTAYQVLHALELDVTETVDTTQYAYWVNVYGERGTHAETALRYRGAVVTCL